MAQCIAETSAESMSTGTPFIARIPGIARGLAAAGLLLAGTIAQVQAQNCPAGSFNPFAAHDNQSPSQTVVANNVVMVGSSRLQLTHTTAGSASINTNAINDQHVAGQIGVRLGHGGNANSTSNYIESTYAFRNPANLSQYLPVSGLVFSLHDVDAADNVIVDAYPAGSSTPISLSTSIYTLDTSTGATVVSYAGSNRFTSQAVDIGNRRGTINFDFAGYSIDRVVLRYYDTSDAGTYTAAGFLACNATLTLNKTTLGGSGGPFGFTLTNTSRNTGGTATTSAANSPVQVDGNAGTAGVQPFGIANAAAAVTIAESSLPTGWSLTNATCSNAAGTTVGSLASGTYTIPGGSIGPAAALTCTFTNARTTLRLQKALPNGRALATDQFTLSISGTGAPSAVTTTGTGSTATGTVTHTTATAGSSYTLSEAGAPGTSLGSYVPTYSCSNARPGGQTPSGSGATFNVTPVAGDDLTCTFSNARRPQLTLIKTVTNDDGGTQVPSAWTLSAAGPTAISGATGSAAVTNAALNPGTYTLSESTLPSGYSATPYSCSINGGVPASGNSVTLAMGDSAVCRIHNDDTSAPGQPVACGISSHSGANGASFVFGPVGVNASASLQNITFDAGSTAGGSINRFVDSTGRAYTTPAGPGRWLLTNSNTTTRLTVTFSPAIPAHRIGLAIYDIGTWDATMPNNSEDPAYNPSLTLSLSGGATPGQFVAHQTGVLATLARYTPASGVVTMDSTAYQSGVERTWRQSVFLRGNANALVSTLTLTATNIKPGDNIGFGLVAIPSCVTVSKVTEGGVGSFNFTTTNVNNWDNTAAASPIALTTTATGTPVSSARHYYAHPVASTGQGTQPVILSEAIPASWILSPAQCTDANSSRNGNTGSFGSLAGGTLTIPADRMRFESNITCTFTNTRAAILRLQKALPDGRAAAADQFTLSMTGAGAPAPLTTTGTGSAATGTVSHATATPGSAYVLSEAAAGGADLTHYVSSYSCSNARSGGQAPSGSGASFGVTPAAGDDLTCTFSNLRRSTDISILKTVAADPVVSGGQAQFTLVVTNHGPMAADGATLRDPAMAGLDCTTAGLPAPTCSATPGTTCPSPLTAAGLQAGLPVPTFPSGGVVTLGLTCSVTASGTP